MSTDSLIYLDMCVFRAKYIRLNIANLEKNTNVNYLVILQVKKNKK